MARPATNAESLLEPSRPGQVRRMTGGTERPLPSDGDLAATKFPDDASSDRTNVIAVGQKLPDSVLGFKLRGQDGRKTTLQAILDQSRGGLIVSVFSKLSKKEFLTEFKGLAPGLVYPHLDFTSVGLSNYATSINASIVEECAEYVPDEKYCLLSDPNRRLLEPMGFVRPQTRSKAWATRMRRHGRIRCGFFIIQKDGLLYTKQTGPLPNVVEAIAKAATRLHNQWVSNLRVHGKPIPPW